jgi:hypothetical protein
VISWQHCGDKGVHVRHPIHITQKLLSALATSK